MTTTRDSQTTRPGTNLIKIGLGLVVVVLLFTLAVVAGGGRPVLLWLVVPGLALAAIGFARRVLAALER